MDKKPYQVGAAPLLYDGERYEPGDIVELTEKEAAALGEHITAAPAADGDDAKAGTKKGTKA